MRIVILSAILLLLGVNNIHSQVKSQFPSIPDSLKENADAVYRIYSVKYTRTSVEEYNVEYHYKITVLNKSGKHASDLKIYYDKDSQVSKIKGNIYSSNDELIGKIKKVKIRDYAQNNNYTIYSDHRIKHYSPAISNYPYTVEYKYSISHKGVVGFQSWMPNQGYNISVQDAELTFENLVYHDIKYRELNYDFTTSETFKGDKILRKWTAQNIKAFKYEKDSPGHLQFMPCVLLSPLDISYKNRSGSISSWESYGKWVYNLIEGRDKISEETQNHIHSLTDTLKTDKEKVKVIYEYMQSKTRYVNIALGIGGFQPMMAMSVDRLGYGDCKALSNYTLALLKHVNIKSYYTEIGSGKSREIYFPDFASTNQTNHIILCVPNNNDTVWLECTSQRIPFGYIGSNNLNRYALLIKEEGGELVKTPKYNETENSNISATRVSINEDGSAKFHKESTYNNCMFENIFALIHLSKKEQKDELLKRAKINGLSINEFKIEESQNDEIKATLEVEGLISKFTNKAGKRLIFSPKGFIEHKNLNIISEDRKQNIYQPFSMMYQDTILISLPKGYRVEKNIGPMAISSEYGEFKLETQNKENEIIIISKLIIKEGTYSKSSFDEIDNFISSILNNEKEKIIIVKQE